ncbi:MAG: CoA pyrophosphatase [Limnochordaceae bacterium]|nr:CoA pyrophosphatase [Limnochordaceae bacterium]
MGALGHGPRAGAGSVSPYVSALRRALASPGRARLELEGGRPAAVLVPIYRPGDEDLLVLTRRTEEVEYHKGQISFPGGAADPEDDGPVATALRESAEEIGLDPRDVEVLGLLDDVLVSHSGFRVTPVAGVVRPGPYRFVPSPAEVAEIVTVPVEWLLEPGHEQVGHSPSGRPGYVYEHGEHFIWGATGRIIHALLETIRRGLAPVA